MSAHSIHIIPILTDETFIYVQAPVNLDEHKILLVFHTVMLL